MRKFYRILIYILKFIVVVAAIVACLFVIGGIIFNLSNNGTSGRAELARDSFALLFAFATLFFSWSRSIREDELEFSRKISGLGEMCLFTSVVFLLAAVLQFYQENSLRIFNPDNLLFKGLTSFAKFIFPVLFFSGFACTFLVLYKILIILNKRFLKF